MALDARSIFLPGVELGPGVGAKEHTRFEIWVTFAFAVGNWELRSMGPFNDIAGIWNCTASKTVVARQIWRQKISNPGALHYERQSLSLSLDRSLLCHVTFCWASSMSHVNQ